MESLLGILMGKVELADMEVNSVIEMLIHVLSTIVIQLQTMPPTYFVFNFLFEDKLKYLMCASKDRRLFHF